MKQILPRFGQYLSAVLLFLTMSTMGWGQTLLNESFESTTFPPSGWSNSPSGWIRSTNNPRTGSACAATNGANDALTTPLLVNPNQLSFWYRRSSNNAAWELIIEVSTSLSGPWTTVQTITSVTTSYQEAIVDLSSYQDIYIRFRDNRSSGNVERYIDDVVVTTNNIAPLASSVNISGTLNIGQELTGNYTYSDADGDVQGTSTFQWYRADNASGLNAAPIAGATNQNYTLTTADNGKYIRFGVIPVAQTGTSPGVEAFSSWQLVNSFPVATNVAVTGVYTEGQTLQASYDYSDADNDLQGTSLYQWLEADDINGTNEVEISGATNSTYVLTTADIGKFIRVRVTPAAISGSSPGLAVFSAYGGPVTDASTPTISLVQTLEAFGNICVNQVSNEQTYTVSALSLTGDLTITAPTHFQIKTGAGAWGTEIVLSPTSGTIAQTTIEVRFAPTAIGVQSGNITHTSAGATPQNFTILGTAINTLPTVGTPTSTNIGTTSATLGGNITNEGCQDVTTRGVEYSTTNKFVTGTGIQVSETGSFATGAFTVEVSSLNAGTTYYYRAFATSSAGTAYSDQASFTTLSTNANLSNLVLSAGTLTPAFDTATVSYTASVSGTTSSITVTPTVQVTGATIQVRINGESYTAVNSGNASGALTLNVGNNTVEVLVTAQDATTTKLYTITVSRPEPPVLIAGWDFSTLPGGTANFGPSPYSPTSNSSNVSVVGLTRSSGVAVSGNGASSAWGGASWDGQNMTFTIKANTDYNLSLSNISEYNVRRSATGATTGQWQYSLDGTNFTNIGSSITWGSITTAAGNNQQAIGLFDINNLQNVDENTTITFRLNLSGGTTGTWYLNNFGSTPSNLDFSVLGYVDFNGAVWQNNAWSNTTGPSSTISADIQEDLTLNSNLSVKNLYLTSGTLNLNGYTLTVNGSIIKTNGSIQSTNGKVVFSNPTNTSIPNNTFVNNTLEDLELNTSQQVTLNGTLKITGVFTPTQGTLNSNGNLIIGSDANGTARVAPIGVGASITGNVVVERYLPARRAWRFLTAPVTGSSNNSIFFNWQNNGSTLNNATGVNLWSPTGTGNAGNGLVAGGGSANIYKYKTVSPAAWEAITDTKTEPLFTNTTNNAFMVFVTGGANSTNIASGAEATTMIATGALRTGNISYGNLPSTIHTLIGNPYASPISPLAVLNSNPGFRDKLWVLDPEVGSVGQYVIYDKIAGYSNTSGSYQAGTNIQSGQAFFVRRSSLPENTGATFTITEAHKAIGVDNGVFNRNATQSVSNLDKLRVSLWKNTNNQWQNLDAVLAAFYPEGNNEVDMADGGKINGVGENMALMNGTSALTIEHRATAIAQDVLPVRVSGMLEGANYQLRVQTEGFNNPNVEVFLHDTFTNTFIAIPTDDTLVNYPFTVTSAAASTGNRFQIVFQNSPLSTQNPGQLSQAVVYPNPVSDGTLHVALPMATYQKVALYNTLGQVVFQQNASVTTNLLQISTQGLANGYYQLQVEDQQGQVYQAKVIIHQ